MYKLTKVRKVKFRQTDKQTGRCKYSPRWKRETDSQMYKLTCTKVRRVRNRQQGQRQTDSQVYKLTKGRRVIDRKTGVQQGRRQTDRCTTRSQIDRQAINLPMWGRWETDRQSWRSYSTTWWRDFCVCGDPAGWCGRTSLPRHPPPASSCLLDLRPTHCRSKHQTESTVWMSFSAAMINPGLSFRCFPNLR